MRLTHLLLLTLSTLVLAQAPTTPTLCNAECSPLSQAILACKVPTRPDQTATTTTLNTIATCVCKATNADNQKCFQCLATADLKPENRQSSDLLSNLNNYCFGNANLPAVVKFIGDATGLTVNGTTVTATVGTVAPTGTAGATAGKSGAVRRADVVVGLVVVGLMMLL